MDSPCKTPSARQQLGLCISLLGTPAGSGQKPWIHDHSAEAKSFSPGARISPFPLLEPEVAKPWMPTPPKPSQYLLAPGPAQAAQSAQSNSPREPAEVARPTPPKSSKSSFSPRRQRGVVHVSATRAPGHRGAQHLRGRHVRGPDPGAKAAARGGGLRIFFGFALLQKKGPHEYIYIYTFIHIYIQKQYIIYIYIYAWVILFDFQWLTLFILERPIQCGFSCFSPGWSLMNLLVSLYPGATRGIGGRGKTNDKIAAKHGESQPHMGVSQN